MPSRESLPLGKLSKSGHGRVTQYGRGTPTHEIRKGGRDDASKLKPSQRIEGEWLLEEGGPQLKVEVSFESGKVVMESDQPRNLGGGGTRPGPLDYCFYGLVLCYTATFATVASTVGVELRRLTAKLQGDLNFSRGFGLSQQPVMEEVHITLQVEGDAPREKLEEVERVTIERCPAVFALTEQVKLSTSLEAK